jgi:hypothetical protein
LDGRSGAGYFAHAFATNAAGSHPRCRPNLIETEGMCPSKAISSQAANLFQLDWRVRFQDMVMRFLCEGVPFLDHLTYNIHKPPMPEPAG